MLLSLTLLAGAASPGASLALVMQRSLQFGRQAGLLVGISHGVGILFYAGAVALGAATLQDEFPQLFRVLQIIGLGFLGYLGLTMLWGGWRARSTKAAADTHSLSRRSRSFSSQFSVSSCSLISACTHAPPWPAWQERLTHYGIALSQL